jgi:hypothetical protein
MKSIMPLGVASHVRSDARSRDAVCHGFSRGGSGIAEGARFSTSLPGSGIIHIGSRFSSDRLNPMLSAIVLNETAGATGLLETCEIPGYDLRDAKLVVLIGDN